MSRIFLVVSAFVVLSRTGLADDRLRSAIERIVPLLERASAGSAEQRECFTCHNQGLPILALSEARRHGFEIEAANFQRQLDHTHAHLERNRDRYLAGDGTGGKADTAGYALWALTAGHRDADATTEAVAEYLLLWQADAEHWSCSSHRPPSEASDFTTTFLALRGLAAYGTEAQQDRIAARRQTAEAWLCEAVPANNEDRAFRLRALKLIDAAPDSVTTAASELISRQRGDGGWSQLEELESDAYATATTLVALHVTGSLQSDEDCFRRGIDFLLSTQLEDGSWHVTSRSDPFQTYYESGFPHGADQFISTSASAWATLALLAACPVPGASQSD